LGETLSGITVLLQKQQWMSVIAKIMLLMIDIA